MSDKEISELAAFTFAIILLFVGKLIIMRQPLLQKYSIPEPVIGGFLFAIGAAVVYYVFDFQITIPTELRDTMLVVFFTGIGLKADLRTLVSGGKPLAILLALASTFIVLQNIVGVSMVTLFGEEPVLGLMGGSISLIGGVGTTVAWAPIFAERFGFDNAADLGFACNTIGLISACVIGGPIAKRLIEKHKLETGSHEALDIGIAHDQAEAKLDYMAVLFAFLKINLGMALGLAIDTGLRELEFQMPLFVSCLMGGIIINNVVRGWLLPWLDWPGSSQGLSLVSDIALGLFLTLSLMGMQLWVIMEVLGPVMALMAVQITLSIAFTMFLVFRFMGRDYESAVICAGFGGITLGSTATAIVNMTAVSTQYGAAHRAFIIVPLVAGFFIDIVNALVINQFIRIFG